MHAIYVDDGWNLSAKHDYAQLTQYGATLEPNILSNTCNNQFVLNARQLELLAALGYVSEFE